MTAEHAVRFGPIGGVRIGVVHIPVGPPRQAVLIPASGGQTRVGVGRVFVSLARAMAEAGFAVMRFDTRGTGDSDGVPGTPRAAEHLSPEIAAALEEFERRLPAGTPFVLCGLCGGASAVLTYAPTDRRVAGVVLLNPWVPGGDLDHWVELGSYYLRRLSDPDLWLDSRAAVSTCRRPFARCWLNCDRLSVRSLNPHSQRTAWKRLESGSSVV